MYKVSVIIPTYNAEDYLSLTIESVITQTLGFENIELILVDDASTDKTTHIINNFSEKYDNIVPIFFEKNSGSPSKARNMGMKVASSEYVMFLDNDDFYYEDMCEKLYSTIKNNDVDLVICRYNFYKGKDIQKNQSFLDGADDFIIINSLQNHPEFMRTSFLSMPWSKIYRKKLLLNNNIEFPEGCLYEDAYFFVKTNLNAKNMIILNNFYGYGYKLRIEENNKSTCQEFTVNSFIKHFKGFKKTTNLLKDKKNAILIQNELVADFTKIFIYTDLEKNCQKIFLKTIKPFYKTYKINTLLPNVSLLFNIVINILLKIFSINNNLLIVISDCYSIYKKFNNKKH